MKKPNDMSDFIVTESGEVYDENGRVPSRYQKYGLRGQKYEVCKYGAIHRLVASRHIPNSENKTEVHHKDENVKNNHVSNLMWVTPAENNALSGCCYEFIILHNNEKYITQNISRFCEKFNLDRRALSKTSPDSKAKEKRKHHKGYSIIKKKELPLCERILQNLSIPYIEKTG